MLKLANSFQGLFACLHDAFTKVNKVSTGEGTAITQCKADFLTIQTETSRKKLKENTEIKEKTYSISLESQQFYSVSIVQI